MSPYQAWPFLSDTRYPTASAIWAVFIHGVIGLIVLGPLIWRSRHRSVYALIAFIGGSALDLDHVVAAGSVRPLALETLQGGRPVTHSILLVAAMSLVAFVVWAPLARVFGANVRRGRWIAAWSVFAVNFGHLLFDAAGGHERLFYPSTSTHGIPWLLCPAGVLALMTASFAVDRWRRAEIPLEHPLPAT